MANVADVLLTAQNHMNDYGQTFFNKASLINFLQEAHRELQIELNINGIPVIKKKTAIIKVPAIPDMTAWTGSVNLPNQPTDLITPIECWERQTGSTLESDFELMIEKSWTPEQQPVQDLIYWVWNGELIKFIGATQDNDVKLYFNGGITLPSGDNDVMGFVNAEAYIAPKLAAFAMRSIGSKQAYAELTSLAKERLEKILQYNILAEQAMPVRRRPYRRGRVPFQIR